MTGATVPEFGAGVVVLVDPVVVVAVPPVCLSIVMFSPDSVNVTRTTHCATAPHCHLPSNVIFQLDRVSFVIVFLVRVVIDVQSF